MSFNQTILHNSPLPMAVFAEGGQTPESGKILHPILYLNPAFIHTFGYTQDDIPTLEDWWPKAYPDPDYRRRVVEQWTMRMEQASSGEKGEPLEVDICCKDGRVCIVQVEATSIPDGDRCSSLVTLYDVTALRNTSKRLQTLLETASDGVHILDEDGNVVELSQSFARMLGYSQEEASRLNVVDWDAAIPRDRFPEFVRSLIRQPATFETRHRRKDGSIFDAEINAKGIVLDGRPHLYASTRDVSERHAREAEIAQLKERYQRLFDNSPDAYLIMSRDGGRIIDCNRAAETMLRGTREQILGMTPDRLSPMLQPSGETSEGAAAKKIAESLHRHGHRFEWLHRRLDGEDFWAEVAVSVIVHEGSQVLFVSWRDISERKTMEAALEESRRRLFDIIDFLPDATFVVDENKVVIAWNKAMEEMSGVEAEDIIGHGDYAYSLPFYGERRKQLIDLLDVEDVELEGKYFNIVRKGGALYAETFVPKVFGGKGAYVWAIAAPLFNAAGERAGAIETIRDITERKQAEDQAKRFEAIVQSSDDAIISKSLEGIVTSWNPGAEKIFGYSAGEMIGRPLTVIFPSDRLQEEHEILNRIRQGMVVDHFETLRICKDGRTIDVSVTLSPIRNNQGCIVGVSKIARDVTAAKLAELALAKAKLDAEAANQAKSAFLATMSHEIRTPLNAIIGTTYLMGLNDLGQEQRRDLNIIEVASKNLLTLINDILDFSKIEAGELALEQQTFMLQDVLNDLGIMFSAIAAGKGLLLDIPELPGEIPQAVVADGTHLRQMLVNLLNNAIKFTEAGRVSLGVELVSQDIENKNVRLRFTVIDTGIGIAPEAQAKLFLPFSQVDSSTGRQYGGTGLGLSIVKRLAELMKGSVGMSSDVGRGSRFWLELPFAVSDELPSVGTQVTPSQLLRILVAEDADNDRNLLIRMCENFGWEVEAVDNGEAMLAAVERRSIQQKPIDCILLDWRMPKLDGLAALSELKRRIGEALMPSVIMVTAYDRDALIRAMTDNRPNSILTKPVDPSTLFNHVNEAVVAKGCDFSRVIDSTIVDDGHCKWLEGIRVMVVDDSHINLEVTQRILDQEGAVSTLCESGEKALAMLKGNAEAFDIVLMDLQMPGMDGCETTRQIRESIALDKLPVIALTAGSTTTEQQRASASGMNDFLGKPIEPHKLVRMLRHHVERTRGKPLPIVPALARAETQVQCAGFSFSAEDWPEIDGIDKPEAANIVGGDFRFFKELLGLFFADNSGASNQIGILLDSGQTRKASRQVHKLRGQAANIGAVSLRDAAAALEEAINANAPDIDARYRVLDTALRQLMNAAGGLINAQQGEQPS
ncbi:MAG: PAS domain S-box protein [Methylomonas sp.]|nr:PAS domain S-box protein [Methylomonas sp.]